MLKCYRNVSVTDNMAILSPTMRIESADKPECNRQAHHDPAELAAYSHASGQIGLHDKESHCGPKHYIECVQDPVRFVALPATESLDMLGGYLVDDEHEGFGALCLCQVYSLLW
jgi:hypothetical protein